MNEASALTAKATTTAVMEAAEKEVVVQVDLLKGRRQNARHAAEGENKLPSNCSTAETGRRSHPLGAS